MNSEGHIAEAARPLGCTHCDKRFCYRKDLNRHSASRHRFGPPLTPPLSEVQIVKAVKRPRLHSPVRRTQKQPHRDVESTSKLCKHTMDDLSGIIASLSLSAVEKSFRKCQLQHHTCLQTLATLYDPAEMIGINGCLIVVTSRLLALELSTDFCGNSSLKLRSLRVPKQKTKLENEVNQLISTPSSAVLKIVLVNPSHKEPHLFDVRYDQLRRLLSLLQCRMNIEQPESATFGPWSAVAANRPMQGDSLGYIAAVSRKVALDLDLLFGIPLMCAIERIFNEELRNFAVQEPSFAFVDAFRSRCLANGLYDCGAESCADDEDCRSPNAFYWPRGSLTWLEMGSWLTGYLSFYGCQTWHCRLTTGVLYSIADWYSHERTERVKRL